MSDEGKPILDKDVTFTVGGSGGGGQFYILSDVERIVRAIDKLTAAVERLSYKFPTQTYGAGGGNIHER